VPRDLRRDQRDVQRRHDEIAVYPAAARARLLRHQMPRLDELLARNLGCSKTAAARAIQTGRVHDDAGAPLPDRRLDIAVDRLPRGVLSDEQRRALHDRGDVMLNKPLGVVTALRDERHPTAYALLRGTPLHAELRAVGRLDLDTTGLLLWTTDG